MDNITTIILAVFASTGFWAFVTAVWQAKAKKKSAESRLLMGLAYSKICLLSKEYIERGELTKDEYEELNKYLYIPYREMGGNGTCEKLMSEVNKLPIKG